ncbi:hypothetical protein DY000_02019252 [Brassica cretica]|uniref:Protein kinase domain-containing protein n=1 Tax=Brassica cretica TaxID=69181 RepID=A0ABQ7D5B6_BRACR|nr:hypothetical protein DY000_02019252 [Brassica cretica]
MFPRNSVGLFRGNSEETKFCVSSEFPRKFLGIFRGFHFPSECPSEYRCFLVVFMFFSEAEEEALPWGTRVKIATGIAQGVAFIHSIKNSPLHQELRMHNVLLDEQYNAKLVRRLDICGNYLQVS